MYSWHDPKKDLRKGNHFQTGYSSCFLCFFQLVSFAYSNTNTIGRRLTPFGLIYSIFFFALYPINNNYNFFLISPLFLTHFAASVFFPSSSLIYAVFFFFSTFRTLSPDQISSTHTHIGTLSLLTGVRSVLLIQKCKVIRFSPDFSTDAPFPLVSFNAIFWLSIAYIFASIFLDIFSSNFPTHYTQHFRWPCG